MEDRPLVVEPELQTYCCPGEVHPIDRAVHLARLTTFYPACRRCAHRADVHLLSTLQQRQWAEIERRAVLGPRFTAEGLEGHSSNDITVSVARQLAGALAGLLWRDHHDSAHPPTVLVGADGHWTTAELVAGACQALQWSGCRAIEAGAVTSAALAAAAHASDADAALLIGNFTGRPHSQGLKLWGRAGRPWSSPGTLDTLAAAYESPDARPRRRGGGLERADAVENYLAPLAPLYHGLRRLRFVVDTPCAPLVRYLAQLCSHADCQVLRPPPAVANTTAESEQTPSPRRANVVGRQVVGEQAHFGVWISGDGECAHWTDQRGAPVDSERMIRALAGYICREKPNAALVLERDASSHLEAALAPATRQVVRSNASRQSMSAALESTGAVLGAGPSGRYWFSGRPPAPDALLAVTLLLTILSQSDRSFSEVLDAA